jgi:hypothetical protein
MTNALLTGCQGTSTCHTMQPGTEHVGWLYCVSPPYQHHEGSLERIVSLGCATDDSLAGSQYHRAVPLHNTCEGRFIMPMDETAKQRCIVRFRQVMFC